MTDPVDTTEADNAILTDMILFDIGFDLVFDDDDEDEED